jgi:hypothetical protein
MEETLKALAESIAIVAGASGAIPAAIGVIAGALFSLFGGKRK